MNTVILSAEIAALVPSMALDCRENNAQLIQGMIERALGTSYELPKSAPQRTIETIIEIVSRYHGATPDKIVHRGRITSTAWARMVSVHFAAKYTELSTTEIAAAFGYSGHKSVLYAIHRVKDTCEVCKTKARELEMFAKEIEARI